MAYRVYILQNPKGSFYIGFSENTDVRLAQHNAGMSRSTRSKGPWHLIWQSEGLVASEARTLERELKRQKGGNGFYQMTELHRR